MEVKILRKDNAPEFKPGDLALSTRNTLILLGKSRGSDHQLTGTVLIVGSGSCWNVGDRSETFSRDCFFPFSGEVLLTQ